MNKQILILIFGLFFTSCEENDPGLKDYDYLMFGHFYGFCAGEACVEIFKITGTELYEDTKDVNPRTAPPYSGDFTKLDRDYFNKVKGLENYIPSELINTKEKVIGQPDAGDWGGIYFEYAVNGKKEYWILDKNRSNLPEVLIPFVEQIEERIAALQPSI